MQSLKLKLIKLLLELLILLAVKELIEFLLPLIKLLISIKVYYVWGNVLKLLNKIHNLNNLSHIDNQNLLKFLSNILLIKLM
jgi:hypothetical protein